MHSKKGINSGKATDTFDQYPQKQKPSDSEPARFIRASYGSTLIDIQKADSIDSAAQMDVSTFDNLDKLAERFKAMILHVEYSRLHRRPRQRHIQQVRIRYPMVKNSEAIASEFFT